MTLSRRLFFGCVSLLVLAAPLLPLHAQGDEDGPPNVLVIQREYLKPGKGGLMHERSEAAFVKAFADSKANIHYFALDSLSGPTRSLFMTGYNTFADWEKDNLTIRNNKSLAANFDHAQQMDGELLASYDSGTMMLRRDLSLGQSRLPGTRYFEISTFVVKPGHQHDFEELGRMYVETMGKISPDVHWDCFEVMYGAPMPGVVGGSAFVVITLMKSMAEVDQENVAFRKMAETLGPGGMQKMGELEAASIVATTTNLFEVNPRMSFPPQRWIDSDPGFWNAVPPANMKASATKPAKP